jgi:hypothetical protein
MLTDLRLILAIRSVLDVLHGLIEDKAVARGRNVLVEKHWRSDYLESYMELGSSDTLTIGIIKI